jgi:hypothetical protein
MRAMSVSLDELGPAAGSTEADKEGAMTSSQADIHPAVAAMAVGDIAEAEAIMTTKNVELSSHSLDSIASLTRAIEKAHQLRGQMVEVGIVG